MQSLSAVLVCRKWFMVNMDKYGLQNNPLLFFNTMIFWTPPCAKYTFIFSHIYMAWWRTIYHVFIMLTCPLFCAVLYCALAANFWLSVCGLHAKMLACCCDPLSCVMSSAYMASFVLLAFAVRQALSQHNKLHNMLARSWYHQILISLAYSILQADVYWYALQCLWSS